MRDPREKVAEPTRTPEEAAEICRWLHEALMPEMRVRRFRFPWRRSKKALAPAAERSKL